MDIKFILYVTVPPLIKKFINDYHSLSSRRVLPQKTKPQKNMASTHHTQNKGNQSVHKTILLLLSLLCVVCLSSVSYGLNSTNPYFAENLEPYLIAYYGYDSFDLSDSSENGYDRSWTGSTYSFSTGNIGGKVLHNYSYYSLPLQIGTSSFSLSMIIERPNTALSEWFGSPTATTNGIEFNLKSNGGLGVYTRTSTSGDLVYNTNSNLGTAPYHLAYSWDASTFNSYVWFDGVLVANYSHAAGITANRTMYIGYAPRYTSNKVYSYTDEVSYYDNKVFNQSDVDNLYGLYSMNMTPYTIQAVSYIFNSQTPSDINLTNVFSPITINYSLTNHDTTQDVFLNWSYNSTKECSQYELGVCIRDNNVYNTKLNDTSDGSTYTFTLTETLTVPATTNIRNEYMYELPKQLYTISNSNHAIKLKLQNVSTTAEFYTIEAQLNSTVDADVSVFLCNSSYDESSNYKINANCEQVGVYTNVTGYNHTHGEYAYHDTFPLFAVNGSLNGFAMTNDVFIIFQSTQPFSLAYATNNTATCDTTTTNGNVWTALSGTCDVHIHQFEDDDSINYQACAYNDNSDLYCSDFNIDSLEAPLEVVHPPLVSITYPENLQEFNTTDVITIEWVGNDLNNDTLTYTLVVNSATIVENTTLESYPIALNTYSGTVPIVVYVSDGNEVRSDSIEIIVNEVSSGGATIVFDWNANSTIQIGSYPTTPHGLATIWFIVLILIVIGLYGINNKNAGLCYLSGFGLLFITLITWYGGFIVGAITVLLGIAMLFAGSSSR